MRRTLIATQILTLIVLLSSTSLNAQESPTRTVPDQDLQLLRKDLRSMKKQLVAANMQLTDAEAQKFWPVYDQYAAETSRLYDARYAIIKDYAQGIKTLTDSQAQSLVQRWVDADLAVVHLRQKYLPIFEKVIAGKKTAMFFQIDRRLALIIDLQLASEIPLVQP